MALLCAYGATRSGLGGAVPRGRDRAGDGEDESALEETRLTQVLSVAPRPRRGHGAPKASDDVTDELGVADGGPAGEDEAVGGAVDQARSV